MAVVRYVDAGTGEVIGAGSAPPAGYSVTQTDPQGRYAFVRKTKQIQQTQNPSMQQAAQGANDSAGTAAGSYVGSSLANSGAADGAIDGGIASLEDGSTLMADGSVVGPGTGWGGGVGPAGIVAGAYTGYQQAKGVKDAVNGKKLSAQEQAALALPTFGGSLVWNHTPWANHKSTKEIQDERFANLSKQGLAGYNDYATMRRAKEADATKRYGNNAGYRPDLAPDYVGFDPEGNFVNNKFAKSRDEKDLHEENTVGQDFNWEEDPNWATAYDKAQRREIQRQYIAKGLIREHQGTYDLIDKEAARAIREDVKKNWKPPKDGAKAPAQSQSQQTTKPAETNIPIDPATQSQQSVKTPYSRKVSAPKNAFQAINQQDYLKMIDQMKSKEEEDSPLSKMYRNYYGR